MYRMEAANSEFRKYAESRAGIARFTDLFTVKTWEHGYTKTYTLFDKIHRIGDKPAVTRYNYHHNVGRFVRAREWWHAGQRHRGNDQPAIMCYDIDQNNGPYLYVRNWFHRGNLHRGHDKPAIIYEGSTYRVWVRHGVTHRGRGRPAEISGFGDKVWRVNGKLSRPGGRPVARLRRGRTFHGDSHALEKLIDQVMKIK
jgi:hypothetical protein